jgi:hypothetical protein
MGYCLWRRSFYCPSPTRPKEVWNYMHSEQGMSSQTPKVFNPRSVHVRFLVVLRQVLSKYFSFPCQFSIHQMLHFSHLSSLAGTVGHAQPKYRGTQSYFPNPPPTCPQKKMVKWTLLWINVAENQNFQTAFNEHLPYWIKKNISNRLIADFQEICIRTSTIKFHPPSRMPWGNTKTGKNCTIKK